MSDGSDSVKTVRKSGLSYKVEELLALRDSVSESAVSIDKFGDEDCIKQHVLRPSVSANGILTKDSNTRLSLTSIRKSSDSSTDTSNLLSCDTSTGSCSGKSSQTSHDVCNGVNETSPDPSKINSDHATKPINDTVHTSRRQFIASNSKKASPSPSVKRGKAERLLKEHGSPPGVRVTAGGRVVPAMFSPQGMANQQQQQHQHQQHHHHHHHQYSANPKFYRNRFVREHDTAAFHQGFIGYDHKGRVCQKVGNSFIPLKMMNGAGQFYPPHLTPYPMIPGDPEGVGVHNVDLHAPMMTGFPINHMGMAAAAAGGPMGHGHMVNPMMDCARGGEPPGAIPGAGGPGSGHGINNGIVDFSLRLDSHIDYLEAEYRRLDKERRNFERFEVLKKETLVAAGREELVNRKRKYVLDLDHLRKTIKQLRAVQNSQATMNGGYIASNGIANQYIFPGNQGATRIPVYANYGNIMTPNIGFNPGTNYGTTIEGEMMMNNIAGSTNFGGNANCIGSIHTTAHLGSVSQESESSFGVPWKIDNNTNVRRPCAIEIKDPRGRLDHNISAFSSLDPTSPNYVPRKAYGGHKSDSSSPLPTVPGSSHVQNKQSNSSVTTSAFFPVNTHEHSSFKAEGKRKTSDNNTGDTNSLDKSNGEVLATPEKTMNSSNCSPTSKGDYSTNRAQIDTRVSSWTRDCDPVLDQRATSTIEGENPVSSVSSSSTKSGGGCEIKEVFNRRGRSTSPFKILESNESESYLEGYYDGLGRKTLSAGDKSSDYLNGYCQGLHKSLNQNKMRTEDGGNSVGQSCQNSVQRLSNTPSERSIYAAAAAASEIIGSEPEKRRNSKLSAVPFVGWGTNLSMESSTLCGVANGLVNLGIMPKSAASVFTHSQKSCIPSSAMAFLPSNMKRSSTQGSQRKTNGIRQYTGNSVYGIQSYNKVNIGSGGNCIRNSRGWTAGVHDMEGLDESNYKKKSAKKSKTSSSSEDEGNKQSEMILPSSPTKKGPSSPAKAKLEQIANRVKKIDRSSNSHDSNDSNKVNSVDDKRKWKQNWRNRFDKIKKREIEDVRRYKKENPAH